VRCLTTRNRGSAAARNEAIRAARGRYIAVLDADDTAAEQRLAVQTDFLSANPDIDVLGAVAQFVGEDGKVVATSRPEVEHETIVRNIYRRCPFVHSTVVARRSFFEETGGYNEALRRCQDYDLWLRGHRTSVYHNLETVVGRYKVRSRPLLVSDLYVASVLLRATWRDRRFLRNGHMAFRPMVATALDRMGLLQRP
jgi:glycosyltransferase involved in cell wall biosynthesis